MWYAVHRSNNPDMHARIMGFITEDDYETPKAWESEEQAEEDMKGHILEPFTEYIEL